MYASATVDVQTEHEDSSISESRPEEHNHAESSSSSGTRRDDVVAAPNTLLFSSDADPYGTSPGSTWSSSLPYSAENASLRWFGLLATDASDFTFSPTILQTAFLDGGDFDQRVESTVVSLQDGELLLFQHFVHHLSCWIDITDPGKTFSVLVPQMALQDLGLMNAILALSSRHLSLSPSSDPASDRTQAVQYYNETLRYLQQAMKNPTYLRSDELLATVLTISTYEMIDGSDRGWERHLKGVFWIQRSQLIHGESHGLKKWIWWAWLRQDIWAAYREKRQILSYYTMTRACVDLDFWELVNRAVWLLGQCINYASEAESTAGRLDVQTRLQGAEHLWSCLEEWRVCFMPHDRRLPGLRPVSSPFAPVWINPSAASTCPTLP